MADKKKETVTVTNQAGTKVEVSKERAEVLKERADAYNALMNAQAAKGK